MKVNKWTLGLAAVGLVSLPSLVQAEEKPSPVLTALSSTTISGYVSTSMEWNPGTGNAFVPGFAFNAGKEDGFNLDVVKLTIERPLDEGQWSAGYKVDLLFGPDANSLATASFPLGSADSDLAIKNAYVDVRAPIGNGLDLKLGVWDTIIGYETFDSGSNPNYTRSYGYSIEPTTHTGLLASYQVSSVLSLAAGIANTFGPTINGRANPPKAESSKTYMASIALTAPDSFGFAKGATLYGCFINGFNSGAQPAAGAGGATQLSWYVGATVPTPVTGLKLGACYDYARQSSVGAPTPAGAAHQEAAAAYLSFQATEKLSLHSRGEYFWQSGTLAFNGAGVVPGTSSSTSSSPTPISSAKVIALTETVQYDLWKNVLSRLEVRWDHAADNRKAYGGTFDTVNGAAPGKKNAVLVAANLIYKF
jgi:hypothetical protein